jgi:ATP-dependent RNA circularization protein (DNA/RNA ligase family)
MGLNAPPKYPRIPHVISGSAGTLDDVVLPAEALTDLLEREVLVEEKLDGMNVMVWIVGGEPRVGTRGGAETSDRSGERGRLKAWAAAHAVQLVAGLGERYVLYGEWLRRRHGVPYEQLPNAIVGLDVLDRRDGRFLSVDERDAVLAELGVPTPPRRFRGILGSTERLETLLGTSAFADERAEGVVVRSLRGDVRAVAKLVDPAWRDIGSLPWTGENRLVA